MKFHILNSSEAPGYIKLTFRMNRGYLLNCGNENIIAAGAADEAGKPCGLALALSPFGPDGKMSETWHLISIFTEEECRGRGVGRGLWNELSKELRIRGCKELHFQAVLREDRVGEMIRYFNAMGFEEPKRLAQIFAFDSITVRKSPFVKGALADSFQPDPRFRFVSYASLSRDQQSELERNEGGWYPPFVSPLIGKESANEKCTIFAVDRERDKTAGWITALNVNDGTRILYRSFFTREEYRDTPVGFFIFTQAIKNHLEYYPERGGLSSIPTDNERAMRFSALFFRGAYDHISYEIESNYRMGEAII